MCWFCHTLTWICHECTRVSHPELPSHLPPHPIPLGHYFKPTFSLSCFTFIKRLFSSSLLFAIRVVSSAYLRLLIFLLVILIPACALSSLALLMMYSAYKLNKQGDNIQPWRPPFPIWNSPSQPLWLPFWMHFLINIFTKTLGGSYFLYFELTYYETKTQDSTWQQ